MMTLMMTLCKCTRSVKEGRPLRWIRSRSSWEGRSGFASGQGDADDNDHDNFDDNHDYHHNEMITMMTPLCRCTRSVKEGRPSRWIP
jgi:hypothetical protein